MLELQTEVERLVAYTKDNTPVTLNDVCFQPMAPANTNCTIMSVLNYFQVILSSLLFFLFMMDTWRFVKGYLSPVMY